ncbi:MAG: VWA domain-containing protein [Candidatus Babeliales bacterium]
MILRLAYLTTLLYLAPIFLLVMVYRLYVYRSPCYVFPFAGRLAAAGATHGDFYKYILFMLRTSFLAGLLFLIARPQWVDENSRVNVKGVDIVLAIDVSGSMQIFDDLGDRRSRIDVAKQEAIRFIEKRLDDPIGIVIFAKDVLARCPLTLDKIILKELVGSFELGLIDESATSLGTGLATAVSRLRTSKAKSRIVILLTDGAPSPQERIDVSVAMNLAQQAGVKVYTVGIGNEKGGYVNHPFFGVQQVAEQSLNIGLLQKIADTTGGKFFRANKPGDMRTIYDTIDRLEKTDYETNVFHNYYEAFLSYIWWVVMLLVVELLLRFFVFRGV